MESIKLTLWELTTNIQRIKLHFVPLLISSDPEKVLHGVPLYSYNLGDFYFPTLTLFPCNSFMYQVSKSYFYDYIGILFKKLLKFKITTN